MLSDPVILEMSMSQDAFGAKALMSDDLRFDDDDFCTLMCSSFWATCGLFACID